MACSSSDSDDVFERKKSATKEPKSKKRSRKSNQSKSKDEKQQRNRRRSSLSTSARKKQSRESLDPVPVPKINSPHDIRWHQRFINGSRAPILSACFIRRGHETNNTARYQGECGDDSSSDEEEEIKIEYLSAHLPGGRPKKPKRMTVLPKRLIPFHGNLLSDYDHDNIARAGWCEKMMKMYLAQQDGPDFNANVERNYLQNVLRAAKRNGGYKATDSDSDGDVIEIDCKRRNLGSKAPIQILGDSDDASSQDEESDELEEPYTQAMVEYNSEDEINSFMRRETGKGNEPIRPGDVIEYCNPIFVKGSAQGRRIATIISVNPKRQFSLQLSNNEYIPDDTDVKRIKTLVKSNGKHSLIPHAGIYRPIHDFKLVKLNKPKDYHIETEGERIRNVLKKNMKKVRKKAEKNGFAPMDMFHRMGKKGDDDRSRESSSSESVSDCSSDNDSDTSSELGIGRRKRQGRDTPDSKGIGKEAGRYRPIGVIDLPTIPPVNQDKPLSLRERLQNDDSDEDENFPMMLHPLKSTSSDKFINTTRNREKAELGDMSTREISSSNGMNVAMKVDSDGDVPKRLLSMKGKPTPKSSKLDRDDAMKLLSLRDTDSDSDYENPKLSLSNRIRWTDRAKGGHGDDSNMTEKENLQTSSDIGDHSDDDLPQAMFDRGSKRKQQETKQNETSKSPRMRRNRVVKQKLRQTSDSDDSMTFHSDTSPAKKSSYEGLAPRKPPPLAIDSSSDSESESSMKLYAGRKASRTTTTFSSAVDDSDDDRGVNSSSHEDVVGSNSKNYTATKSKKSPIYIKESKFKKRRSHSSQKKSSEKKRARENSMIKPLSFSIRKYN